MPRYSLRTLMIVLAIGPPMLAGAWFSYHEHRRRQFILNNTPPAVPQIITNADCDGVKLPIEIAEN